MRLLDQLDRAGSRWHPYANASNGFKDLLAWLAASSPRERPCVVMPSYVPAKLYRAALAAGCRVRFYEVHGACRFDLADVERSVDGDTIAILHVHYFGFPGEVEGMRALALRLGTALIEDCALTIGATHRGRALGTFGDAALFSMRKVLLYPEGGALVVGDRLRDFRPRYEGRVSSCYSFPRFLLQRAKYAYVSVTRGADPLGIVRPAPMGYMDGAPRQVLRVKRMSEFSRWRLRFGDVERIAVRRRENYLHVLERFPSSPAIEPMFPALPEGCTPYSFPALVHDDDRDEVRQALLRDGILAGAGWPESPFDATLVRTRALAQSLLELPIHQNVTRPQLERTIRCIERRLRSRAASPPAPGLDPR